MLPTLLTPSRAARRPPAPQKERYDEISAEMRHMLVRVGWKDSFVEKCVPIIPISGWMGDNLIKPSENMTWWTGVTVSSLPRLLASGCCVPDLPAAEAQRPPRRAMLLCSMAVVLLQCMPFAATAAHYAPPRCLMPDAC